MADASPINDQSDPNLSHLAVTPTTTRDRSTRLADIEPQRVIASAECHMPVFHANDIHSEHSLSRKPTNHSSPDGLSDIPRTALDTINGDNNSQYYEATEKDLIPYLSSDEGERSYGVGPREIDDSDVDLALSTTSTTPKSRVPHPIPIHHSQTGDCTLDTSGPSTSPRLHKAVSDGFLGASPTLPDGHGVLRTVIEGLDPAEYAQEASLPPPPTVVSDAGNQHFKGQNRINSNSNSSCRLSQKTLEDQLFDARHFAQRPHTENWRGFIPKGQLDGIITEESVFRELKACLSNQIGSEEIREYAKCVCRDKKSELPDGRTKLKSFKSIFALLVLFRKPAEILDFLKEDVSDIDLPLVSHGGTHHIGRRNRMSKPGEEETTLLGCFFKWSRIESESFLNYQWMMISPFFKESQYNDVQHYELHENHILPWIASNEDDYFEQQVGFGAVFPVRIHKEHHNFGDLEACRRGFAIKQLFSSNPVQFQREVGILQKFVGKNSHPHIVSLLATYLHRGKYHMIFYRAKGDLLKYWKAFNPKPNFDSDTIVWMAKQCEGIAGGLVQLHRHFTTSKPGEIDDKPKESSAYQEGGHTQVRANVQVPFASKTQYVLAGRKPGHAPNPEERKRSRDDSDYGLHKLGGHWQFGRHGDLKPENILWFEGGEDGRGTLKIADFGQAELHEWHCKTRKRSEVADTMAYRAPECHFDGKRFRQSSDVWSLGCLFLVFVAWTLGGEELVSKFASDRSAFDQYWGISSDTFFQIDRLADDAEAWSVMVKPAVVQFIHQLRSHPKCSDYIHDLLDLIYTKMLVIESKSSERRMACIHVHRELKRMRERCCADADYATAGNPWAAPRDMPVSSAPVQVRPPNAMMMVPIAEKKMQSAVNGGVKKKVSFGVTRYQCLLTRAQTG